MREIKFRAWDVFYNGMFYSKQDNLNGFFHAVEQRPESERLVMQYTGLKDKNGKEIYEGDILEWSVYEDAQDTTSGEEEEDRWRDSVYFSNGCFALEKRKELLFNFLAPHKKLEIIGNIYENPNLLTL